jgi:hypothetical protein
LTDAEFERLSGILGHFDNKKTWMIICWRVAERCLPFLRRFDARPDIRAARDIQLNYFYSFAVPLGVLNLDSRALSAGAIAREKTNIQATITAQVNATAFDGTTTLRKSGTARTTLRDKATAKSDHSGQFLTADANHLPSRVVARLSDNARADSGHVEA